MVGGKFRTIQRSQVTVSPAMPDMSVRSTEVGLLDPQYGTRVIDPSFNNMRLELFPLKVH